MNTLNSYSRGRYKGVGVCACEDDDSYCCWASRYNMGMPTMQEIRDDGGPCQCSCHDDNLQEVDEADNLTQEDKP